MAENIELLLQQTNNVFIPAIVFEYISKKDVDFEINDLKNFYSSFGEVVDFIIKGKLSIVLYKTFFAANACREFLLNENNFKDNMKNNFIVRWFDFEKDIYNLPGDMQEVFKNIQISNIYKLKNSIFNNSNTNTNIINSIINSNEQLLNDLNLNENINNIINSNIYNINNNINENNNNILNPININRNINSNNNFFSSNITTKYDQMNLNDQINDINNISNNINSINIISNLNDLQNNLMMQPPLNSQSIFMNPNQNNLGINNIMEMDSQINNFHYNQNLNQIHLNSEQNVEEKNLGSYTCKYEILIPNDKNFQIVRRLIGNKGCNMKNIVNQCKTSNNIKDSVKLRLRGRGSGYKEGPENKESDEPLHLCISAKNQEEMNKACNLVDDLLNKIYQDYINYCYKNNIPFVSKLAKRIDYGNSLHKMK
jgi:hypothetical protein